MRPPFLFRSGQTGERSRLPNPTGALLAAPSAFHVSIDPDAGIGDRLGSSGAGTKKEMADRARSSPYPAALSAFHVSIDPDAGIGDRLGSSGTGTKKEMARLEGAIPNPKGSQARPRAGRSGRPIGDVREANCREIRKMARLEGNSSNALFETLQDWEHQLKHSEIDFKAISEKPKGPHL
ncbi:hypothetical protein GCM10017621_27280 [Maricaulis virginensis]|uniref:Uncharacterized protein n=1 Tax=Maricaulis virginensis TaxID=144022 RepID=A0A9W6IQ94_9PROT|nr:hypothetical protein GCM10017621_27280 [Maricaulis virginensis]